MTLRLLALLSCGLAFILGGCSHYQLGTEGKLAFTTLYVEPVENETTVPQARALLSTQIREAFARDGRVVLVNSAAEADAVLRVVVKEFRRDVSSLLEQDPGRARKFALVLGVDCTLRLNNGDTLFSARRVEATRDAFTDGGQLQAEYQTLPLLADSLAQKITHTVLDVW